MGALDTRAGSIRFAELVCGLPPSHGLKRVMVLAGLQADAARLPLCSCALRPRRAGCTVAPREARLENSSILRVGVRQPGDALFACGTRHDPGFPIDYECTLVEARIVARLPAWILRYRTDDLDAMFALAGYQHLGIGAAFVHEMRGSAWCDNSLSLYASIARILALFKDFAASDSAISGKARVIQRTSLPTTSSMPTNRWRKRPRLLRARA